MKKIGANCGFIARRNRELADKARRMAVERGVALEYVVDEVAETEASRFWVDEDRAMRIVQEKRRGKLGKRGPRRDMAEEISRRTETMLRENPGMKLSEAVFEVVNSPAPSFYVSGRTVRRALAARKRGYVPEYRNREKPASEEKSVTFKKTQDL